MIAGFDLHLQDYCSYCGDFEPNITKINVTAFEEKACSYATTIKCENEDKCARIRENLKRGLDLCR